MTNEVLEKRYLDNGEVMPPPREFRQGPHSPPRRIIWDMTDALAHSITQAAHANLQQADDLDLFIEHHSAFGKGVLKKALISPDAFVQIALQLAYFRDSGGRFVQTYEASATRLYQHGRTETVRSCTRESSAFVRWVMPSSGESCLRQVSHAFVRAMSEDTVSRTQKLALLREAGERHQSLYKAAMNGEGIDRHLFALYVVSRGLGYVRLVMLCPQIREATISVLGYDCELLENVIKRPWTLSTSQQPQQQVTNSNLPDINFEPFRKMSPWFALQAPQFTLKPLVGIVAPDVEKCTSCAEALVFCTAYQAACIYLHAVLVLG
ncbi:hypothetical protein HAZT_HAZT004361 [Hyalella azteca]|uniref:Choline/carnitine acyltransferase domain-containing protein n=1 Tax=Hyalella azteca TaxID=294128 RepID=A0A6A0GXE2_HYAAZ|nr:hypothetical protein HAZT_HAZT004361 [Hyalella azteca]